MTRMAMQKAIGQTAVVAAKLDLVAVDAILLNEAQPHQPICRATTPPPLAQHAQSSPDAVLSGLAEYALGALEEQASFPSNFVYIEPSCCCSKRSTGIEVARGMIALAV